MEIFLQAEFSSVASWGTVFRSKYFRRYNLRVLNEKQEICGLEPAKTEKIPTISKTPVNQNLLKHWINLLALPEIHRQANADKLILFKQGVAEADSSCY